MRSDKKARDDRRCDERRLERVLRDADEESAEFRETARHVEACPQCRQRLAELSADDAILAEACETLRAGGEPTLDRKFLSSSVAISVERLLGEDNPVDCETVSLDFLGPASHPEMLGRIGRYDIERLVGAGGMGVVLKGFDTELHRVVAIKVQLPQLATSAAARRRFAREAQAAAAVVHEHVIPIYNVETDGDLPYLVMQFVPGHSLQTRVDEHGPLGRQGSAPHRAASGLRPGGGACAGRGASRRQAGEHSAGGIGRSRAHFGFRPGPHGGRRDAHADGDAGRNAALHVARTGVRPERGPAVRFVQPGERDLLHVHGPAAVPRRVAHGGAQPHLPRAASPAG